MNEWIRLLFPFIRFLLLLKFYAFVKLVLSGRLKVRENVSDSVPRRLELVTSGADLAVSDYHPSESVLIAQKQMFDESGGHFGGYNVNMSTILAE